MLAGDPYGVSLAFDERRYSLFRFPGLKIVPA